MGKLALTSVRVLQGSALVALSSLGLALVSCDASDKESSGTSSLPIVSVEPPTSVEAGSPSPRQATCPGDTLPDQCGSWAGVELTASRGDCKHKRDSASSSRVSHCLCEGIDFQIPAQIPVVDGRSGRRSDEAVFSFRNAAGTKVSCRYRGNGTHRRGGNAYTLDRCSDGSKAGQSAHGDYFKLSLDDHGRGVAIRLTLGEPDVVGGVVQEQVFYSDDARIPGAALHVPRGSAPPGETFSLDVVRQVPPGTVIDNAGDGATALGYAVDVHADSSDSFAFTPVPGAACPRIELPYDQGVVARLLGPDRESAIQAQQLLRLTGIRSGAHVLEPAGPATVDLAARTVSFCVEHLSYWVATTPAFNASLQAASIRSVAGAAPGVSPLPVTDLMQTLPSLNAGETYELTLTFRNLGSTTWTVTNVRLVPVDSFNGTLANFFTGTSTWAFTTPPWSAAPHSNSTFTPTTVPGPIDPPPVGGPLSYTDAQFVFNITAPSASAPLNFCLRPGNNPAFGECFTWDLPLAPNPGTTPTTPALTRSCYTGSAGTLGVGSCTAGTQTFSGGAWGACAGEVTNQANETACDGKDEDCDGTVDDGVTNACGGCGACVNDATFIPPGRIPSEANLYYDDGLSCDWEPDVLMLFCPTCDGVTRRLRFDMKNTGTKTWKASTHKLIPIANNCQIVDGPVAADGSVTLGSDVPPGQSVHFNLGIQCPACDEGTFSAMMAEGNIAGRFGDRVVQIACSQSCQ